MKISFNNIVDNRKKNAGKNYPDRLDSRIYKGLTYHGVVCPVINPKFRIDIKSKVFTIGSCFAREIENRLLKYGLDVPTKKFILPEVEQQPGRNTNAFLNEYNPGTMAQKISSAIHNELESSLTIVNVNDGHRDLLFSGAWPVDFDRALQRRNEVLAIYRHLLDADILIMTLGLNEAWYDNKCNTYLNQMPPWDKFKNDQERYDLHKLNVNDCYYLIKKSLDKLFFINKNINVILTVSPVPFKTTFSCDDAVIANCYSKSVLRSCTQMLCEEYNNIDYFPSYEMVTSSGFSGYVEDNIHVKSSFVDLITKKMIENYID